MLKREKKTLVRFEHKTHTKHDVLLPFLISMFLPQFVGSVDLRWNQGLFSLKG